MGFVVCCKTSIHNSRGGKTHVTFSDVFQTFGDANSYLSELSKHPDIESRIIKKWGSKSYLIELNHSMYINKRPPHVATDIYTDKPFTIFVKNPYIVKI
jgi:hypothetical protein